MDKRDVNTALDLWEIAHDFGTTAIGPKTWVGRYRKDVSKASGLRAWERLKVKIRQSPFPVEFVTVSEWETAARPDYKTREDGTSSAEVTFPSEQLGIKLPRHSLQELTKILDAANGVSLDD